MTKRFNRTTSNNAGKKSGYSYISEDQDFVGGDVAGFGFEEEEEEDADHSDRIVDEDSLALGHHLKWQ